MQIKAEALGHREKLVNQVVLSDTPQQFHNFLSWFKLTDQITGEFGVLIGYIFEMGCSLLDDQHSAGVLGCNR